MRKAGDRGRTSPPASNALSSAAAVAFLLGLSCSARPEVAAHSAGTAARADAGGSSTAALPSDGGALSDPGRVMLAEPESVALDFEIMPVEGGRSVLLVASDVGGGATAIRRIDGKSGRIGPLMLARGEAVFGSLDGADERFTLVTSSSGRLCLATYKDDEAMPESRGCAAVSPVTATLAGDRVALIEATQEAPPEDPESAKKPDAPSSKRHGPHKRGPRIKPKRTLDHKKSGAKAGEKPKPAAAAPQGSRPKVEVRLRWATRAGVFDAEAQPIGLRFERPLEGMHVVAAGARSGGIDLLWYEFAGTKGKNAGPYGGARLVLGTIGNNDRLDPATRKIVLEGPLEFGSIEGHHRPRLVTTDAESIVIDFDKDKKCEAHRPGSQPTTIHPSTPLCLLAPARLSSGDPVLSAESEGYARIFSDGPRRVAGQTGHDVGLVAWAGERAYYLGDSARTLRSSARSGEDLRDEPHPFVASRSRIAWGAIASDGEGLAFAGGKLRDVGPTGAVTSLDGDAPSSLLSLPELAPIDRRRVARIGKSWWIARGDVVRLLPLAGSPAPLVGRGHPDTTALVGGAARGLLLELDGPRFSATPLDENGIATDLAPTAIESPIRPGFDAATRGGGGAIVAGVAATPGVEPGPVVAFRIDAEGKVGSAKATSLHADGLAVRLVALPEGGALLSDRARKQVVWLDDDAREIASAVWPDDRSDATCVDGAPARAMMPSPLPGRFVRVAELAAPGTCVVGDPAWGAGGVLRWFGSHVQGLDARAEMRSAHVDGALAMPPPGAPLDAAPSPPSSPPRPVPVPACPGDMVSIAEQFCVDRFESELVDATTGTPLAPDFSPSSGAREIALGEWVTGHEFVGDVHARALPLPPLPLWQRTGTFAPRAVSRMGVRPSGYVSGIAAAAACEAAGKRLCLRAEFVMACRGEADEVFPYGDDFEDGACNVFRDAHPAAILHGNASIGHLDPRLNRVIAKDGPMLHETGGYPRCRSRWGADAVYDMVGNLDEWVDDPSGFAGGFYSRATRSGCDAMVTTHPPQYLDYSLGVRCCKDAARQVP